MTFSIVLAQLFDCVIGYSEKRLAYWWQAIVARFFNANKFCPMNDFVRRYFAQKKISSKKCELGASQALSVRWWFVDDLVACRNLPTSPRDSFNKAELDTLKIVDEGKELSVSLSVDDNDEDGFALCFLSILDEEFCDPSSLAAAAITTATSLNFIPFKRAMNK